MFFACIKLLWAFMRLPFTKADPTEYDHDAQLDRVNVLAKSAKYHVHVPGVPVRGAQ